MNPDFFGYGDYHLRYTSPCIDEGTSTGAPADDIDGQVRPNPLTVLVDMGADEFYESEITATPRPTKTPSRTPTFSPTATNSPTPSLTPTETPTLPYPDLYVDQTTGNDENDGASWATAKATVGSALAAASSGFCNIHVAEGTYQENLILTDGITLLGGYPAGGGERDPSTHITILDGGEIDSTLTVVFCFSVTVDGFTIQNGLQEYGGGIYCFSAMNVEISNNVITGNTAYSESSDAFGGGVYALDAWISINGNTFTENTSVSSAESHYARGGGIYGEGVIDSVISGNVINDNYCYASGSGATAAGGGLYTLNNFGTLSVTSNQVTENIAQANQNATTAKGGGIYCAGYDAAVIANNEITGNKAQNSSPSAYSCVVSGGGVYCDAGGTAATISDNEITGNSAYSYYYSSGSKEYTALGGGMSIDEFSSPYLIGNTIESNTAYCYTQTSSQNRTVISHACGGGIYSAEFSSPHISGGTISENTAYAHGHGTQYQSYGYGYAYAGGIYFAGSSEPVISDFLSISDNVADGRVSSYHSSQGYTYGGGFYCGTDASLNASTVIISGNACTGSHSGYWYGGAGYFYQSGPVSFDRCEIMENEATYGAGFYENGADGTFTNCFVVSNSTDGFYLEGSSPEMMNLSIANNGGAGVKCMNDSSPLLTNCIVWFNGDDLFSCPQASYSDIGEGSPDGEGEGNFIPPVDPVFLGGGDYHLSDLSPCIDRGTDAGAPDHDIDGESRPHAGTKIDMGADETDATNPTPLPTVTITPTATPTFTPTATITPEDDHYYVDGINGDDSNDGLNWETAKASIRAGINLVSGSGTVHVAATTYYENISLTSGVTLLGGYPAGGGARDPETNLTVIDGEHNDCTVKAENGAVAVIDGFTVTNGDASLGGGIYCLNFDGITISHNVITGNTVSSGSDGVRGGGIYSYASNIAIESNTVTANTAASSAASSYAYGGGIYCGASGTALITGNEITNNLSSTTGSSEESAGGGLFCEVASGTFTITENAITENTAQASGSSSKIKAGGFFCSGAGIVNIENNQITENRSQTFGNPNNAEAYGGGVYHAALDYSSTLTGNVISDNNAYAYYYASGSPTNYSYGGGIYMDENSSPVLSGNSITNNTAYAFARSTSQNRTAASYSYGGGIYCGEGSSPSLDGDVVAANTAYAYGHASQYQSTAYGYVYGGGCCFFGNSSPSLSNFTVISDNAAEALISSYHSSQAYSYAGGIYAGADVALSAENTFVKGNYTSGSDSSCWYGGGFYFDGSTNLSFDKCDIRENESTAGGGLYLAAASGSFSNCFVALNSGDAFYLVDSSPELTNMTVAGNTGDGAECTGESAPVITNCIFWDNDDDLDNCSATYSDIEEGAEGEGNLDPPANPDVVGDGNYHLRFSSPCLDVGTAVGAPMTDFDGEPRPDPLTGQVDMGADEFYFSMETPSPGPSDTPSSTPTLTPTPTSSPTLTFTPTPTPAPPYTDLYVDQTNGNAANDGLSWAEAKATVGSALAAASATFFNIHVAEGTYEENLILWDGITLLGGYPAGGGPRDPTTHVTIIDSRGINSAITIVYCLNVTIDGFTIQNGRQEYGGGIYCYGSTDIVANNNVITGNTASSVSSDAFGGGIYALDSSITVSDNVIIANTAESSGADHSTAGAGMYGLYLLDPEVTDNAFSSNVCSSSGSGSEAWGAGIYCGDHLGLLTIAYNEITDNSAEVIGNAYNAVGGGIYCTGYSTMMLTDNTVTGNKAQNSSPSASSGEVNGGGIYCAISDTNAFISNNDISENTAYSYYYSSGSRTYTARGGGIYIDGGGSPVLSDNTISLNTAYAYTRSTSSSATVTSYPGFLIHPTRSYFWTAQRVKI